MMQQHVALEEKGLLKIKFTKMLETIVITQVNIEVQDIVHAIKDLMYPTKKIPVVFYHNGSTRIIILS